MKKLVNFGALALAALFSFGSLLAQTGEYEMKTIGSHSDEVLGVFVNWDNTKFASCSLDETIKIWSLPSGKELQTLTGHMGQVNNISFSGNDKQLASGSGDQTVKIWDVESGKLVKTLSGHTDQVIGVYFSQDKESSLVASTSFDKTVKLWDIKLGAEVKTLRGHTEPTNNVAYSYDGKYLASCSDDKTIKIWSTDINAKDPIITLTGHPAPVLTVLFSFDSQILASSDQAGNIYIWSTEDWTLMRKIKAHSELVQDVSFAEDNRRLVSASLDKTVKLWDITTGRELMNFDTGVEVWSVDIVSDASIITLGCADGSVRLLSKKQDEAKPAPTKKTKKNRK